MIGARRVVLNLMPLLDILLIVIFAQYLDLQNESKAVVAAAESRASKEVEEAGKKRKAMKVEKDIAVGSKQDMQGELDAKATTIKNLRQEKDDLKKEKDVLKKEKEMLLKKVIQSVQDAEEQRKRAQRDLEEQRKRAQGDLEATAEVLSDILHLPSEAFREELEKLPADKRIDVKRALEDIQGKGVSEVIQHLRKLTELKKRCNFWEVFLDESNRITFKSGDDPEISFAFESKTAFVTKMEDIARDLPDHKRLVIILYSHGDSQRKYRSILDKGLPELCENLETQSDRRNRYELAKLGYTPVTP